MSAISVKNKRIAKNTIYLYVRMIFFLLIKLYISRVALQVLGVLDYGIYNLVAGIIVMFSFLNSAMNGACQRFFNIALGENNLVKLKSYFINSVNIHFFIGVGTIILSETIGMYLLNDKLNIPEERMSAAYFTFHLAVASCFMTVLRTPYNAIIIAYEKMSFYAYVSIVEVVLNLAVVFILPIVDYDKLNLYSILMLSISIGILIVYVAYCNINFPVSRYKASFSKSIMKSIMSFSLWSTLSSLGNVVTKQALNIILNIFYGVAINAATAIMTQISAAVYSFIQNFQIAANPQLIQSYASKDFTYLKKLFRATSKISIYLMLYLAFPTMICMDEVLSLWLGKVPEYTAIFCILSFLALLVDALGGPMWTVIHASGRIKRYQTMIFFVRIMNIPLYYVMMYAGLEPYTALYLPIISNVIVIVNGIKLIRQILNLSGKEYFIHVIAPILKVGAISIVIPFLVAFLIHGAVPNLVFIFCIYLISIISISISVYFCGLEQHEKSILTEKIIRKIVRRK